MAMRFSPACACLVACVSGCGSDGSRPARASDSGVADGTGSATSDAATDRRQDGGTGEADGAPVDSGGSPGDGAGSSALCKRGIASNAAPSGAFAPAAGSPGITWWYDWSANGSGAAAGIEFDPMIWGSADLQATLPAGSRYVLGFNEPNFKAQSNLTPQQAAADWPAVEALAKAIGAQIVSPAVNFCGSASDSSGCSDPSVTDPYTYLRDFFAACAGCEVDYVAIHWYNCDLPSLQAYIEGNVDAGGGLQGFVQFGKPIWLTEFSCDGSHSVADQKAYMQAAVPYLEGNPHVFRYSWFSASNIASAELANADGSPTDLGTTYVGLPASCP